ncbi:MAG: Gfo/Idh/MocA family oxidoreductase [Planctomycetes bacterium]|nr:Gfo/Idh/MocA family oxidoreductase [Planctomycetota bacterium]
MGHIAVVGVGYWGPNLARNFMSLGAFDGVVACDTDAERLSVVAKQLPGIHTCDDFAALLKRPEIEAVVVATPVRTHYRLAKDALLAGKHVLVEKPMTKTSQGARELIEIAAECGLTLMVDHTFLFTGAVEKIIEVTSGPDFGDFYYIDSVRINLGLFQHDADVVWDLAPHDLSIVNRVLKAKPKVVRAVGYSHTESGVADMAYIHIKYGDRLNATFHVNWLSPTKVRRMIVAGSKKMILWDDLEAAEKIRVYDKGIETQTIGIEDQRRFQVGYRIGDVWMPRIDQTEALQKVARHFVDCCRNGTKPICSDEDGLDVVLALEASDLSLTHDGRPAVITDKGPALI